MFSIDAMLGKTDDEIAIMYGGFEAVYRMLMSINNHRDSNVWYAKEAYVKHGVFIPLDEPDNPAEAEVMSLGRRIHAHLGYIEENLGGPRASRIFKKNIAALENQLAALIA